MRLNLREAARLLNKTPMKKTSLYNRFAFFLNGAVISFSVSALSLLFIIFVKGNGTKTDKIISLIIALVFWAGIISEFVFLSNADKLRKRVEKKLSLNKAKIGVVSFFRNREATVSDVMLFVFALILLLTTLLKARVTGIYVVLFFCVFTAAHFHSYFNGRNYRCLKIFKAYINKQGATKNV